MTSKVLKVMLVVGLFGSCHKAQVTPPAVETVAQSPFKDNNIFVSSVGLLKAEEGKMNFSFTTRYEINISRIEVFKGSSKNNLCSFFEVGVNGESHNLKTYLAPDGKKDQTLNYYMIRYKTQAGEWSYSPLYQL